MANNPKFSSMNNGLRPSDEVKGTDCPPTLANTNTYLGQKVGLGEGRWEVSQKRIMVQQFKLKNQFVTDLSQ